MVNGRKRHIAVDTWGLLICVLVIAASVQDHDAARPLLSRLAAPAAGSVSSGPMMATAASCWTEPPTPCG